MILISFVQFVCCIIFTDDIFSCEIIFFTGMQKKKIVFDISIKKINGKINF